MTITQTEKLLHSIGDIDDYFLYEAETADITTVKRARRKRIIKYSVTGVAVSVGLAMAYWKFGRNKSSRTA